MLIKRISVLVIIFILSLPASVLAAEPGSGLIEGRIVNGTEGSSSVADQDITLKTYLNDAEVGSSTTKTDDEGRFIFDSLSTEPGYYYQVEVTFQEAEYYSEWLGFGEGETSKSVEVTVYDSTTSDEAIKVTIVHTFIYIQPGSLWVEEYYLLDNEADRTYIGSKEIAAGTKETLRFSLPDGATELESIHGLMDCCIYSSDDGFIDTMPVLPGVKEVAYRYKLSYSSEAYTFSQRMNYPTAVYSLLIEGEDTKVASGRLTAEGLVDIEDTQFNAFLGEELVAGEVIAVRLSGLPQTNNQGLVIWVVLALGVLAGGLGLGYLLRKRRPQPALPQGNLEQRRQKLLVELARLDDNFEDGKIDQVAYRRLRAERKSQLVALMPSSKEKSSNR